MFNAQSKGRGRFKPAYEFGRNRRNTIIVIFVFISLCFALILFEKLIYSSHSPLRLLLNQNNLLSTISDEGLMKFNNHKRYCKSRRHIVVQILAKQTKSITFLDIGGHEGKTTFPTLLCLPISHRVITVEPVRHNQNTLSSTGTKLGLYEPSHQWIIVRAAFSNRTEHSTIYIPGNFTDNASLDRDAAALNVARSSKFKGLPVKQDIELIRGDDLLIQNDIYPSFVKIDVQGAESLVIQGMAKTFSQNRNMIVFAEHDPGLIEKYGLGLGDAIRQMISFGFTAYCNPEISVSNGIFVISTQTVEVSAEQASFRPFLWKTRCKDIIYWKMGA